MALQGRLRQVTIGSSRPLAVSHQMGIQSFNVRGSGEYDFSQRAAGTQS